MHINADDGDGGKLATASRVSTQREAMARLGSSEGGAEIRLHDGNSVSVRRGNCGLAGTKQ